MPRGGREDPGGPGGRGGRPLVPPEVLARELGKLYKEKRGWWRRLPAVVEAVRRALGADAEVYVTGSAVEGRLTASSDIDVVVVYKGLGGGFRERFTLAERVWTEMERLGIPWWYPIELHIVTPSEAERLRRGGARLVPAKDIIERYPA